MLKRFVFPVQLSLSINTKQAFVLAASAGAPQRLTGREEEEEEGKRQILGTRL